MVHRCPIPLLFLGVVLVACSPPEPIKIGFLAGLTGSGSELGIGARRALDMALSQINKGGGVKGRPMELVTMDDANEPTQAWAAYQRFDQEEVVAVLGPMTSTVIASVLPYLNEHKILTISPTVSAASVAGQDDWFFRVITLNKKMGEALGDYAIQQRFVEVAVLKESSNDAYTGLILDAFRERLEGSGTKVLNPIEFDLRNQPDYTVLAEALGEAPAYLILASGYDSAQIGQKLAQRGHLGPILGPPWSMTADVISLGGRQVERMIFASIYDSQSQNPAWLAFREAYLARYGEEPGFAALYAHDALTLLVKALEQARTLEPEDLRSALIAVGEVQGLQSSFRLDATGDVVRDLFLMTVRNGQFVRHYP